MKLTSLVIMLGPLSAATARNLMLERGVCAADNCARAITGTNASPAVATRSADCSSYLQALVTPQMPTYASACTPTGTVSNRFASACECLIGTSTPSCLTGPQATNIVNKFASLLTGPQSPSFNATANALLASNFKDTSDSIDDLAGYPLGSTTFRTKTAFIVGQGSEPPIGSLTTLEIFFTCNKIAWRWIASGIGSNVASVKGINTFTTNGLGQIEESWSEFNSLAWAKDYGNPECSS